LKFLLIGGEGGQFGACFIDLGLCHAQQHEAAPLSTSGQTGQIEETE